VLDSAVIHPQTWTEVLPLHDLFPPGRPLEVDVGCGKGRFLVARAGAHPGTDFLGVDRLLRRIQKADRKIALAELANVRLLRVEASYAIRFLLPALSVTTYYVFFPDPWPKRRHHRRRLFTPGLIADFHRTLLPGGTVHVSTDHVGYLGEISALVDGDPRFIRASPFIPSEDEVTEFERIFRRQGLDVSRLSFQKAA
jgi:tRNA (guanine-N7-)-methyltransferase